MEMSVMPLTPALVNDEIERLHVHAVYDQIAPHFSSTRNKPWPIISAFLTSLPPGSIGLDAGTGNGRYLPLPLDRPTSIWTIGLDRSSKLLEIAQSVGGERREVVRGDALSMGWRVGTFDYAMSIATIHHFATPSRRMMAIETLLRCISPTHGRLLVYVWAVEQDHLSKRVLPSTGNDEVTKGQDVFVPWVLPNSSSQAAGHQKRKDANSQVFNRYYHMFASGELEQLTREAAISMGLEVATRPALPEDPSVKRRGVEIIQSGWERSNWYIEMKRWTL